MKINDVVLTNFPKRLKDVINEFDGFQEIRIRANKQVCLVQNSKNIILDIISSQEDVNFIFENICEHSIHTYQDEINQGFITLKNGCRVGIAGSAVLENNKIISIKNINSLNFRIATDYIGCSSKISKIYYENIIIAGPPNSGKTTFLRDIARFLSKDKKVCIVDERQEICGNNSCFDNGLMIDCLSGYKKAFGISLAVRTLSPQAIIFDEIGSLDECESVFDSLNCGVKIITSVHCANKTQFLNRPVCKNLLESNFFNYVVFLSEKAGEIDNIYRIKGNELCEYSEFL